MSTPLQVRRDSGRETATVIRSALLRRALGATLALILLAPAAADAHATRHTTPTATATSGTCSAAMPCRIDHAINAASAGDEVVVAPGQLRGHGPRSTRDGRSTSTASRARRRRC